MNLRIDGVKIENRLIVDDVEHLTPDYREVFNDQPDVPLYELDIKKE